MPKRQSSPSPSRKSAAIIVAAGIFASRMIGFVRQAVVAYYFGVGPHADVLSAAFRMPNVLQNLLGEGTLSAAFIPVYSRMLADGRAQQAGQFAGAIFGLLLAVGTLCALLGLLLASPIVALLTPGFVGDQAQVAAGQLAVNRFDLSVQGVRILFPMTGLLVLSAWALAILNSHRRFFLPYVAPVLWNAAIIATLCLTATFLIPDSLAPGQPASLSADLLHTLLLAVFYGSFLGGALQFVVQLPLVFRVMQGFRLTVSTRVPGVRDTLRAFGPVVAGRGVYQISAWIDMLLASHITTGAVAALGYAQMLYVLPISLFGMSVATAELPELSRTDTTDMTPLMARVTASVRQIMFLTVPTCVGYLVFGLPLISALFERGRFGRHDSWLIYVTLGGYTLGLLATTVSRLFQNVFYALQDTRTPARIALVRVLTSTATSIPFMVFFDRIPVAILAGATGPGQPLFCGAAGLALGATVGAWVELALLCRLLSRCVQINFPWRTTVFLLGVALLAALPALLLWWLLPNWPAVFLALIVLGTFGSAYLTLAWFYNCSELSLWVGRLLPQRRRQA